MPLGMASVGDTNTIVKITGRDEVRQHLAELGYELQRPVHTDITNFISLKSELDDILSVCTGQEYSVLCGKCIGLSDEEIAAKMHVSKSTVRVYWHRAKKRIRDMVLRNASDV